MSKRVRFHPDRSVPVADAALHPHLAARLRDALRITSLFDMQHRVHAHVLAGARRGDQSDLILCAPTGSGKTLAYALPVLHDVLARRVVPRLRAVVVVPTRDLAAQVAQVFRALAGAPGPDGVAVALATGAAPVAAEARALARAEVVVATPGRLVDHVRHGDALRARLRFVRFLVLDESDRLLQEAYDDWLEVLMPLLDSSAPGGPGAKAEAPVTGLLALAIHPDIASQSGSAYAGASRERLRKILVSATQTYNPTHMVHLDMRRPTIFEIDYGASPDADVNDDETIDQKQKYSVPSTLKETGWVVKDIQVKPAALLNLLGWIGEDVQHPASGKDALLRGSTTLVFTNSVESAHRLSRLLELCQYALGREGRILEMSGELSTERRQEVIEFVKKSSKSTGKDGEEQNPLTVVCSDVLSRGMDIFAVDNVINYDAPVQVRTYVHRAGRTARAGRKGHVMTLLLSKQVHHFRTMVHEAERGERKVKTSDMNSGLFFTDQVEGMISHALVSLRRILAREKLNLIPRDKPLSDYVLYELSLRSIEHPGAAEDGPEEEYAYMDDTDPYWDEYNGEQTRKRPRELFDQQEVESDVTPDSHPAASILDGKTEVEDGVDTISDILFAQIGRNLMLSDLHR